MKKAIYYLSIFFGITYLLSSCTSELLDDEPMSINQIEVLGWWTGEYYINNSDTVVADVTFLFLEDSTFSLKVGIPIDAESSKNYKWGGDWFLDEEAAILNLKYEGPKGFIGWIQSSSSVEESYFVEQQDSKMSLDGNWENDTFKFELIPE